MKVPSRAETLTKRATQKSLCGKDPLLVRQTRAGVSCGNLAVETEIHCEDTLKQLLEKLDLTAPSGLPHTKIGH